MAGVLLLSTMQAQDNIPVVDQPSYKTAIGLRAGETSGLSVKRFFGEKVAVEGIVGVWNNGLSTTILYEKYSPAFHLNGLNWYYGAGAHAVFEVGYNFHHHWGDRYYHYHHDGVGLGIDGVVGMEYKIPTIPLALSIDFKPYFEINTNGGIWTSLDPGLGLKIIF